MDNSMLTTANETTNEQTAVEAIRESSRRSLFLNRRRLKDEETDVRRCIGTCSSQSNVTEIVDRLKTKSSISAEELKILKNALIDDKKTTEVVLNTHGALRGLVRELSGHNAENQCAAAGCLCNMGLGDSKACSVVAKAAGSYLVAFLDNMTEELAITSAWTIGNLAGSGAKVCELLAAQGAVSALCKMMDIVGDRRDAAVYALTLLVYTSSDQLSPEHHNKIISHLPSDLTTETCQMIFYLSGHDHFHTLPQGITFKLIEKLHNNLINYDNIPELKYIIRILANLYSKEVYEVVLKCFVDSNLAGKLKVLVQNPDFKELCWLLGNMMKLCGDHEFFEVFFEGHNAVLPNRKSLVEPGTFPV